MGNEICKSSEEEKSVEKMVTEFPEGRENTHLTLQHYSSESYNRRGNLYL